ncbi:DoxX family protein [Glutamicibacter sp.]|uniref:DoxX family protein n=1 Tax=Glutamicibacter sp. TaxID=1931995 RepID=UPI002B4917D2|nr:DoxX family protein [Glutamicibacter sp.]HJX79356.1 DoxX family protein [Glutamicibacter sp.]
MFRLFFSPLHRLEPFVPLLLRLAIGATLIAHGFQFSPEKFAAIVQGAWGLPFPLLIGWYVTLLMFVGGSFIALGFLTRLVTIPLIVHMLLAIFMVEINRGFAPAESGGMQVPVLLIAGLFVLLVTGPGQASLDRLIGWDGGWTRKSAEDSRKVASMN